jgi:hypothetical protein
MPIRKPLAAIVLAVLLGLSAAHTAWAAAQDGSVESIWDAEQQPAALPAAEPAGVPLCSVDTFKQSALLNSGAWPGVGPFHGAGSQLTDASQNKLVVGLDKNRIMTVQMLVTNRPKDLLKLQIAADFLLEAVGATPGRISQFNSQLAKSSNDLRASSSRTPLSLKAGRYLVAIYPDSAGPSTVNYVVRITSKETESAIAAKPSQPTAQTTKAIESTKPVESSAVESTKPVESPEQPAPAEQPAMTGEQAPAPAEQHTVAEQPAPTPDTAPDLASPAASQQPQPIHPPVSTAPDTRAAVAFGGSTDRTPELNQTSAADLKTEFTSLLSRWEQIKRVAMSKRDTKDLSQVLSGKALSQQVKYINWLTESKKHSELTPKNISVTGYADLERGQKYSVYAQITEDNKLISDANNDLLTDKTNTYNVNYTVEKVDNHWTIIDSAVMNQNAPKSLANSPANSSAASAQTATQTTNKTNR